FYPMLSTPLLCAPSPYTTRFRSQKRALLGRIRAQIYLRRLDAGMTEPERDLADIARGLKRMHGAAVPQHMRGDALCGDRRGRARSEEHTSELQSRENIVCRLLLE